MSARPNEQAPQGDAPQDSKMDQSFIAGIGLAGTSLAIAAISFVVLIGAVSFDVWPEASKERPGPIAELVTGGGVADGSNDQEETPVDGALFAEVIPADLGRDGPAGSGGGNRGEDDEPKGGGDGQPEAPPVQLPPIVVPEVPQVPEQGEAPAAPGDTDPGDESGSSNRRRPVPADDDEDEPAEQPAPSPVEEGQKDDDEDDDRWGRWNPHGGERLDGGRQSRYPRGHGSRSGS